MKKMTTTLTLAAALGLGLSGFAQAAYIDTVATPNAPGTSSEQAVPGDNDYATRSGGVWTIDSPLYSVGDTVQFGSNLESTYAGPIQLTFTYLGKEASDDNQFFWGTTKIFDTFSSPDDQFSTVFSGGMNSLLDFHFVNGSGTTVKNDGTNGSLQNTASPFSTTNFNLFEVSEDYFIISFDDGYVKDDNHDDMVIAVRASQVPEPGTLALLGLGLAGLAVRMKGRKKA